MEEGLRSGSISVKPEDKVLPGEGNKASDNKQKCFDLNDEVSTKMDSGSDSVNEMVEFKERDEQVNDECGKTGLDEDERKGSRVDGEENKDNGVVIKRVKEDYKLQNVGRVLRSRLGIKNGSEKESNKSEIEKKDGKKGDDRYKNERVVHVLMEERNGTNDVEGRMKVKGKRGRPSRMQESDESEGEYRKKSYKTNPCAAFLNMKEGLRSEGISEKSGDKVMPREENEVNDNEQKCFDLNDEVSPKMESGSDPVKEMVEIKERDVLVNDECGDTGLDENERKMNRVDGEENKDDSIVERRVKDDYNMQNVGRVLRSRLEIKSGTEKESNKAEVEKKYGHKGDWDYGSKNARDDGVQMEVSNGANDAEERKKVKGKRGRPPRVQKSDESEGEERKKSKGKRGRPPKVYQIDEYCEQGRKKVKGKRGRPPSKVQDNDESDGDGIKMLRSRLGRPFKDGSDDAGRKRLKKKRGRPPKVQESNGVLKGELGKGKKVNGFRKSRRDALRDGFKSDMSTYSSSQEKRNTGKELNSQRLTPSKKIKSADTEAEDGVAMSRLTLKHEGQSEEKGIETKQEETLPRNKAKQLLRDRIVELLLGAGWKIEYRPRNGREYNDTVYVNPEGKTHWSVTLAYRMLKQQYEEGGGNYDTSKTGFTFTPIPEDELNILKKIIKKPRSDKNLKKKKGKDVGTDDEIISKKKKNKGKVKSTASLNGKSLKRGMKEKSSHTECSNSVGTSHKGMSVPARKHKLQKTQNRKRCALLARNSMEGAESDGGFVAYDGKRTVLAWLIDTSTVPLNGKVQYWNRRKTRVILQGQITRNGILCDCCGEIFSISKFETHSKSKLCHPFQNLCLESGSSLLQCILDSWNNQEESKCKGFHFVDFGGEDPNDDTCGICGDGGDLVCCDGCPSTFHQSCLDINKFPSGKWHCLYCTCKYCGRVENTCHTDDGDNYAVSTLQICHLCEEKYHQSCSLAEDAVNYESSSLSFCGKKCQEVFERLQMILGVKHDLEEGYTWSLIHRSDAGQDPFLSDAHQKVECNAKLAVALFVMDECFLPLPDHRSGINLIHNIVYNFGSNIKRLNYCGFFTAILERDDEIISAASIRIHGKELAEMPFIGTRHMYRRQGMCRRLLIGIESALCSLNVEKLVIPAISELRETWTSVFGFKPLEVLSKQKMRNMSLLVFPGVDLLQKPTLKNQFTEENMISVKESSQFEVDVGKNWDEKFSDGFDRTPHICRIHDDSAALESTLQFPDGSVLDTSGVGSETVNFPEFTNANRIDQLGVTGDDLQGGDKTAMDPLSSVSGGDELTEDVGDCRVQVSCAFGLAVKSIASEVEIENGIVKQNPDSCDESAADESAKVNITEHQNLDFLSGLKVSSENVHTCDSEAQMFHNAKVTEDLDPKQVIGCLRESGEGVCEAHEVKSDLTFSQNISVASGDMIQTLAESCRVHTGNNSSCSANQISFGQGNGPDACKQVASHNLYSDSHPLDPFSDAFRLPSFQHCMSNGHCLSTD